MNSTALANLDYDAFDQVITFAVGNSPLQEATITIKQDDLIEGDETFRVSLSSTDANVDEPRSLTVTIQDDDSKSECIMYLILLV